MCGFGSLDAASPGDSKASWAAVARRSYLRLPNDIWTVLDAEVDIDGDFRLIRCGSQ